MCYYIPDLLVLFEKEIWSIGPLLVIESAKVSLDPKVIFPHQFFYAIWIS
jgi:hypothetical protein